MIIGGGIVGLASARDAALRGLKVLLIEKEDFGSGASTKTSKLAHGGLRYLETYDFALVRESLIERNALFENAQGFVFPLRFVLPLFLENPMHPWMIRAGLFLYDLLAFEQKRPFHTSLSKNRMEELYPFLKQDIVKGGFHFYDGTMKDNRLLIENMLSAKEAGAHCINYTKITEFFLEEGRVKGLLCVGREGIRKIFAKAFINATGSQADEIRKLTGDEGVSVSRSKGVHLVLKKQLSKDAILLFSPIDKRVFFLIPWEERTLLGTTDTMLFQGEAPLTLKEDIDYLLRSVNAYLKNPLQESDIATTFVGVRPLVHKEGSMTYRASRSAKLTLSKTGLVTVIGGKYTTFRSIAEETVNMLTPFFPKKKLKPCITKTLPFSSSQEALNKEKEMAERIAGGFETPLIMRLQKMWAHRAFFCLEKIHAFPLGKELICKHHPFTVGELAYSVHYEGVMKAEDWQMRRTSSGLLGTCTKECEERINQLIIYANKAC